ncbi:MAG: site-2 protease family protein [Microcystaceae cyanobacterium]
MRSSSNWQIGTILGIPFHIDSSWLWIAGLVTLVNARDLYTQNLVGESTILAAIFAAIAGFSLAILLFSSVLLHELGHSLVARSQGIKVNSITLFLFGGVAAIERESKTPIGAFLVAIAGPLVSLFLFFFFNSLNHIWGENGLLGYVGTDLARINLILTLFNLIPGLPLDGGQVLKALVWQITGDRLVGIRWAANSGKLLGLTGISLGILLMWQSGSLSFGGLWMGFIGWFILRNASNYEQLANLQTSLRDTRASQIMTTHYRVVNAHLTLREFVETYVISQGNPPPVYFCSSEGRYRGMIRLDRLNAQERSQWDQITLEDIAIPLTTIPSVKEQASLIEVIQALESYQERCLTVLSPADAVAGIIDRGDIVSAIATKHRLPLPDAEIQRIKAEGTYPHYLPLPEIIKGLENF